MPLIGYSKGSFQLAFLGKLKKGAAFLGTFWGLMLKSDPPLLSVNLQEGIRSECVGVEPGSLSSGFQVSPPNVFYLMNVCL